MKKEIVIIDTGYDIYGKNRNKVKGIEIRCSREKDYSFDEEIDDEIGHGTAIVDRIFEKSKFDVSVYMIKIFSSEQITDTEMLVAALKFCYETVDADILLISLGVREVSGEMHEYIKKISEKETIIVSAFDNMKCLSYPAAYKEVIGVDVSEKYIEEGLYEIYYGDNVVDVCGADVYYRLNWLRNKKVILRGTSFCATDIVVMLLNERKCIRNKKSALKILEKKASNVYRYDLQDTIDEKSFIHSIRKAIVLPLNKEIYALAAFEDLCDFEIVGYYDVKYGMKIGKRIKDVKAYTKNPKIIKDIKEINWLDDFDTVICGHMDKISMCLKRNILQEISECCKRHKKKLYAFDRILEKRRSRDYVFGREYLYPFNCSDLSLYGRNGKLCLNNTPTLLVAGTSSKQGKYTILLNLLKYLREQCVDVGIIGSEPSSLLFGFDQYLSYGYRNNCELNEEEVLLVVNEYVRKFQEMGKQIIVMAEQSGILPYKMLNTNMYTAKQMGIVLGLKPDSFILCVNRNDRKEYIMRCIKCLESVSNAKLLCIVRSDVLDDELENDCFEGGLPDVDIYELSDESLSEKLGRTVINFYIDSTD